MSVTYHGHPVIEETGPSVTKREVVALYNGPGLVAQYPGWCHKCQAPIKPGQVIQRAKVVVPGKPTLYEHLECPAVVTAAPAQGQAGPPGGQATSSDGAWQPPPGLPNGVWTIQGPKGHRTYRISTIQAEKDDSLMAESFRKRHAGKRVLELLTGPDNTSSYRGLAWYPGPTPVDMYAEFKKHTPFDEAVAKADKRSGIGKLWKLGQTNEVLVNVFAKLVEREEQLKGYTVHFARHCYICNRLLTTPESIQRGIGPICAQGGRD